MGTFSIHLHFVNVAYPLQGIYSFCIAAYVMISMSDSLVGLQKGTYNIGTLAVVLEAFLFGLVSAMHRPRGMMNEQFVPEGHQRTPCHPQRPLKGKSAKIK
jgi:hypothetical protein